MVIEFKTNKMDLIAYLLISMRRSLLKSIFLLFVFTSILTWPIVELVVIGLVYHLDWRFFEIKIVHFFFMFFSSGFVFASFYIILGLVMNSASMNPIHGCVHRIWIDEERIYMKSEKYSSEMSWSLLVRVTVIKNYIILNQSSMCGTIIPRRAFGSDAEFKDFGEKAVEYFKKSREK